MYVLPSNSNFNVGASVEIFGSPLFISNGVRVKEKQEEGSSFAEREIQSKVVVGPSKLLPTQASFFFFYSLFVSITAPFH